MTQTRLMPHRGREIRCSSDVLKWVGFACVCLWTISTAVVQRGIMHMDQQTTESLYEMMEPGGGMFGWASCAVMLSLLSMPALPIYAKLLFEGWKHTSSGKAYLLRLVCAALVSEIPFDLAFQGKWWDMGQQNPIWGCVVALLMLLFFRRFASEPGAKSAFIRIIVLIAACAWTLLLQCQMGMLMVVLVALFFFFSGKKTATLVSGLLVSLIQFPAPFGMLFVHWYDGEPGKTPRGLFYGLYPAQLCVFFLCGLLAERFL